MLDESLYVRHKIKLNKFKYIRTFTPEITPAAFKLKHV